MTRVLFILLSLAAASSIVVAGNPVSAQLINPFKGYASSGFTDKDLDLLNAASASLYEAEPPVVGSTAEWSNAESGNSGTVELTEAYEWKGMPCRRMSLVIHLKRQADPRRYTRSHCLTPDGEWKIRY